MTTHLFRWPAAASPSPLTDEALLAAMLRFEVALAQAQGELGLIPGAAAAAIAAHAATFAIAPASLARAGAHAGSIAIPFVAALRAHVGANDAVAADHVHFGTTSQDLIDTALILCLRPAISDLAAALVRSRGAATRIADTQRMVPVLARTLMQPAGVTTIGFKAALWALSLASAHGRLMRTAADAMAVSLGGSTGNLAAYGAAGNALRAALARTLELGDPGQSWHTQRERLVALAADIGIAGGTMAKIAVDLSLMMQAEVGEAAEPCTGGSTAMPHKQNPVLTMRVRAASQSLPGLVSSLLAGMAQEHERALGSWQAEMDQYRMVVENGLAAAEALAALLEGVRFDLPRCRRNIDALQGTIFSEALTALFSPLMGRRQAQELVASMCGKALAERRPLRQLAIAAADGDPRLQELSRKALEEVFDVQHAVHQSCHDVDRVLAGAREGAA